MIKCDICGDVRTTDEMYILNNDYGIFTYYDAVICKNCLHTLFSLLENSRYHKVKFVRTKSFEETQDGLVEITEPSENIYYTRYDRMVNELVYIRPGSDERECECGGIMMWDCEYDDKTEYLYPIFICLNCGKWVYELEMI